MIPIPQVAAVASKDPFIYEALRKITELVASEEVPGVVKYVAGGTVPYGYALADGSAVRIADARGLFNAIGTTYGGDGITTFRVPVVPDLVVSGFPSLKAIIKL